MTTKYVIIFGFGFKSEMNYNSFVTLSDELHSLDVIFDFPFSGYDGKFSTNSWTSGRSRPHVSFVFAVHI